MEKLLHCRGGKRVGVSVCESCKGTGKKKIKYGSTEVTTRCNDCGGAGVIFPKS